MNQKSGGQTSTIRNATDLVDMYVICGTFVDVCTLILGRPSYLL